MKKYSFYLALAATSSLATPLPSSNGAPIPDSEILAAMLQSNGPFMPLGGTRDKPPTLHLLLIIIARRMLREHVHSRLSKRQGLTGTVDNGWGATDIDWAKYYGERSGHPGLKAGSQSSNPPPASKVPDLQELKAQSWPEAKRIKVRHGPYRIPPTSEENLELKMMKAAGMSNMYDIAITKPCQHECTLLQVTGSMEYADGKQADNTNGVSTCSLMGYIFQYLNQTSRRGSITSCS
jgi:hypothetical protein